MRLCATQGASGTCRSQEACQLLRPGARRSPNVRANRVVVFNTRHECAGVERLKENPQRPCLSWQHAFSLVIPDARAGPRISCSREAAA
jgi:hypothetical protein